MIKVGKLLASSRTMNVSVVMNQISVLSGAGLISAMIDAPATLSKTVVAPMRLVFGEHHRSFLTENVSMIFQVLDESSNMVIQLTASKI